MSELTDSRPKLRVLYLTHDLPWPIRSGGRVREAETLRRLADRYAIYLIAICEPSSDDRIGITTAARYGITAEIFPAEEPPPRLSPLVRSHYSAAAERRLQYLCDQQTWDVIHVEGHYVFDHLPRSLRQRALLVEHNVESTLLEQEIRFVSTPDERVRLLTDVASTRRCEQKAWKTARVVGAVTAEDAEGIAAAVPEREVVVVPNGADHLSPVGRNDVPAPGVPGHLLFVGNFGYWPTRDAAHLLVNEIFPEVSARCPDTSLTVVGYQPPEWLRDAAQHEPRLRVVGRVPEVEPWLDSAQVVVCPLRIGGGVKVKIVEALRRGRAVVTTSVGMQGLRFLGSDVAVECDDTAEMARACVGLLSSPNERLLLQQRAFRAAHTLPTWDQASECLSAIWEKLADEMSGAAVAVRLRS